MSPKTISGKSRITSIAVGSGHVRTPSSHLYAPLTASLVYLGGTFALFLVVGQVSLVTNLFDLALFVSLTLVALAVCYFLKMRTYRTIRLVNEPISAGETRTSQQWLVVSAIYYALFGVALLLGYGAGGPSDILTAITHPGNAYFAKFSTYAQQQSTGERNLPIQILTLLSILYLPLVPLTVVYGRRLKRSVRYMAYLGAAIYASYFLFIGTLKGLGDLLIFTLASYIVGTFGVWPRKSGKAMSKRTLVLS